MPGRTSPLWEEEHYPAHAITEPPREYCICDSWLSQHYAIKELNREKKRVVFHQSEPDMAAIIVPKSFYKYKVPSRIAMQINRYLWQKEKECGFR